MSEKKDQVFFVGVKGLVVSEGKVLVLKADTSRHTVETEAYWDLPGGKIQQGEGEQEALARELDEEIGLALADEPEYFETVISNHQLRYEGELAGLVLRIWRVELGAREVALSHAHLEHDWVEPREAAQRLSHKYPAEFCQKIEAL